MPTDTVEGVAEFDAKFMASLHVRRRYEPDAYMNMAFYIGNQWVRWDGQQIYPVIFDDWREMEVDNRVGPLVRTEIAKMTKNRPKWVAVPRTQGDDDIASARFGEMALDDQWKRRNLTRLTRAALLWSRLTGAGFWKVWWDPTKGKATDVLVHGPEHPQAGKLIRGGDGGPLDVGMAHQLPDEYDARMVTDHEGEICVELRSFFSIFPDPLAGEDGLDSAEWIGEEAVYSREWVTRHFPDRVDELTFDADPMQGSLEARMPAAMGFEQTTTQIGKGIRLREYWTRERHVIYVKGAQVLLDEGNPYDDLPYIMFSGTPAPGRFWPHSVVTDLRPPQIALNKRISQIGEHAERISNPPLMIPSSINNEFDWRGLPGEQVVYHDLGTQTSMPSFLAVPELSMTVQNDVERKQASLMEISGQHEVTGASVPQGVTAASAISQLQEADDSRLAPDIAAMEDSIAEAGRRMLKLMRRYYGNERLIAIAGDGGRWDVEAFTKDDLNGIEDIEVQAGSGMPDSKAAKQAAIQQIMTLFTQNPTNGMTPRDWRTIVGEMEIGGLQNFFASMNRDEEQVQEENRLMMEMNGGELPINSYDNDEAHIWFHTDFQKTSRYSNLDADTKNVVEAHVLAHQVRMKPPLPAAPPDPATDPGADGQAQLGPGAPGPFAGGSGNAPPPSVPSPT